MNQYCSWVWRLICAAFFLLGPVCFGGEPVYLACIDCYGTASFYPQAAKELFPSRDIRWIHVQTEKTIQKSYLPSFRATEGHYESKIQCNPDDPHDFANTVSELMNRGVIRAVGGMETGTFWADAFNHQLGVPGNHPGTSALRREKYPMQLALGDLSIPSILTRSQDEMIEFAARQKSEYMVLKPNASGGAEHVTFVRRDSPLELWKHAKAILDLQDNYGHLIDNLVVQPAIEGPEFAANTIARNGHVTLTALWRYEKFRVDETKQVYFIDRPIELTSSIAKELALLVGDVHHRLHNFNGPGHTEFVRENGTGKWFVFEQGARVGGSGMSMIDAQVWGTSHLHLHLLGILDGDRFDEAISAFPRKKIQEAATVDLVSRTHGVFKPGSLERIRALKTYFSPADYFEGKDGGRVTPTIDMKSSPATINLAGSLTEVIADARRLVNWQADGTFFEYDRPQSFIEKCKFGLTSLGHSRKLKRRFEQIDWQ